MKRLIIYGMVSVLFLCTTVQAEMRVWTSKKGDTVAAEYVKMSGSKVVLKTAEGKTLRVPVSGLCDDDQMYLSHKTAVPPKIQIEVDDDLERKKKGYGGEFEEEEQSVLCTVVIKKTNREPCLGNFKARLWIIGEEAEGTQKKILGIKEQAVSFAKDSVTEFSLKATTSCQRGYMWANGYEYEGFIVCVEDESGEMVAIESNQNAYERSMFVIRKSSQGSIYTEDFGKPR